ncbi:hypothetical protein D3C80_1491680 [compost metagenome]
MTPPTSLVRRLVLPASAENKMIEPPASSGDPSIKPALTRRLDPQFIDTVGATRLVPRTMPLT